jgi:hypothetical protein
MSVIRHVVTRIIAVAAFGLLWTAGDAAASIDFDGSGNVDFDDFFIFANSYGKVPGDTGYDPTYDLDGSDEIDLGDFFIFADNFGRDAAAIVIPDPPGPGPGPYDNAAVVLSLDTPTEISGVAGGETIDVTLSAAGLVGAEQFSIVLEVSPADAFDLAVTTFTHNAAQFTVSPGVEFPDADQVKSGSASFSAAVNGDALLGTFSLRTSAAFGQDNEAIIEVVRFTVGPNSTEQDVFLDADLDLTVAVNPAAPAPLLGIPFSELSDADVAAIALDGDLTDWEAILGAPALTGEDFFADPTVGEGAAYNAADLAFNVWLAWHPTTERLYVAIERIDDIYINDYQGGNPGDIWRHDSIEFMIDGDNSGGDYSRLANEDWSDEEGTLNHNRTAQQFVAIADALDDQHIGYQGAGGDWVNFPPYSDAGGASIGTGPTTSVIEFYVTPFDNLIWDDPTESAPSRLFPDKLIGFEISVPDFDSDPGSYHAYHRLSGQPATWRYADNFVDGQLLSASPPPINPPAPRLRVNAPNGGDEFLIGGWHNIHWFADVPVADVRIEYSPDGGTSWTEIVASTPNDGLFEWQIPDDPTDEALIHVSDAADAGLFDTSNALFSIVINPPEVTSLMPPWGGLGYPDIAITVAFDRPMDPTTLTPATFLVEGSTSGAAIGTVDYDPETFAATFYPNANFALGETVTVTLSGDVADEGGVTLDSNQNGVLDGAPDDDLVWSFPVDQPLEMVAYPATVPPVLDGRILAGEYAEAVPVYVELSAPDKLPGVGLNWDDPPDGPTDLSFTTLALYTPNDLFIAVDVADDAFHDDSDQIWQNDAVELYMDGDLVANDLSIHWNHASPEGFQLLIDLRDEAGAWGLEFDQDWFATTRTYDGGYVVEFRIPLTSIDIEDGPGVTHPSPGDEVGLNISVNDDDDGGSKEHYGVWSSPPPDEWKWNRESDWGRLYFSPVPAGPIALISPNGSESWPAGGTRPILWEADAGITTVVIEYSTDGGSTWTEIVGDAPNIGLYEWTLPPGSADAVLMEISDASDQIEDHSDRPFSIREPDPHHVERVWTHRRAVFPNEPFSIYAQIEPGEAEIVLVEAELFSEATQQLEDTVVLADDGVDPDMEEGDHIFSGASTIDAAGKYPLDVVIDDAADIQMRQIEAGAVNVVHTFVQFPERILVDPAELPFVSVPLLIEDDGTAGYLTEGFFSAEFDLHLQGNGLEPQAAAPQFLGSGLDGQSFLSQFSAKSWWDGDHDNINLETSLAGAESLFPTPVPSTGQAILAFVDLELDVSRFDYLNMNISHVAFDEDAIPHLAFEGGSLELGKGDIDLSKTIDAFDASLVLMHTVRALNLDWPDDDINGPVEDTYVFELLEEVWRQADVSGKAGVTAFDASLIMRRAVGIITHFPAEADAYRLWEPPDWWMPPAAPAVKPVAAPPRLQRIVSLGAAAEQSDGSLVVPISIDAMEGILAGTVVLDFDAAYLQPAGVRPTDLTENYLLADHTRGNSLRVSFAGVEAQAGSGPFAELLFERIDASFAPDDLRLTEVQLNEGEIETRIAASTLAVAAPLPQTLALHPNYPNPFNPRTTINYDLPVADQVHLTVYNLTGQQVRILIDGPQPAGRHSAVWNGMDDSGSKVGSGVYLFRLETTGSILVRKMLLIK